MKYTIYKTENEVVETISFNEKDYSRHWRKDGIFSVTEDKPFVEQIEDEEAKEFCELFDNTSLADELFNL